MQVIRLNGPVFQRQLPVFVPDRGSDARIASSLDGLKFASKQALAHNVPVVRKSATQTSKPLMDLRSQRMAWVDGSCMARQF